MAPLDERGGQVERGRGLRDAALLVGEGDDLVPWSSSRAPPVLRAWTRYGVPIRTYHRVRSCRLPIRREPLLDKRLVFVTGKGGVGKTTVAAALGLGGRARGQAHDRLRGRRPGAHLAAVRARRASATRRPSSAENLYAISIDPRARAGGVAAATSCRRGALAGPARPQPDLPATSPRPRPGCGARHDRQGLGARPARAPQRRRTRAVRPRRSSTRRHRPRPRRCCARRAPSATSRASGRSTARPTRSTTFIVDPSRPACVAVALPEEMPVNETLELEDALARRAGRGARPRVVVNGLYPSASRRRGEARGARTGSAPGACARRCGRATAACARSAASAARAAAARRRTRRCATLPFLFDARARARRSSSTLSRELERTAVSVERRCSSARRSCICAGSGGVGKTTTSAAIALGHGRSAGMKVAVLTIDPAQAARQLARAAGARQRGGRPRCELDRGEGELWAMMLDAKRTFDELVDAARAGRGDARRRPLATGSTRSSRTPWPARRSTWRWRSSTSSTRRAATTCSCSTRRPPATRSTSSTRRERLSRFIDSRSLQFFLRAGAHRA